MPSELTAFRVFLSAPEGLDDYRQAFRDLLYRFNEKLALGRGLMYVPIAWDQGIPGAEHPERGYETELEAADFFVLLVHDHFGASGDGRGSVKEQFDKALALFEDENAPMQRLVVCFVGVDEKHISDPGANLRAVLEFRNWIESKDDHNYAYFDDVEDFTHHVHRFLNRWAIDHEVGRESEVESGAKDRGGAELYPLLERPKTSMRALGRENADQDVDASDSDGAELDAESRDLISVADDLVAQARYTEAEIILSRIYQNSPHNPDALNHLGCFYVRLGRFSRASGMFKRLLNLSFQLKDPVWMAAAYSNLGAVALSQNQIEVAESMYEQALQLSEVRGAFQSIAQKSRKLAKVQIEQGDTDEASVALQRANEFYQRLGDRASAAATQIELGDMFARADQFERAEASYYEARDLYVRLNDSTGASKSFLQIGDLYRQQDELARAEAAYKKGFKIDQDAGDAESAAAHLERLTQVYARRGDYSKATDLQSKAIQLYLEMDSRKDLGAAYARLGSLRLQSSDYANASDAFMQALEIEQAIDRAEGIAEVTGQLGLVAAKLNDQEKALAFWQKTYSVYESLGRETDMTRVKEWIVKLQIRTERQQDDQGLQRGDQRHLGSDVAVAK